MLYNYTQNAKQKIFVLMTYTTTNVLTCMIYKLVQNQNTLRKQSDFINLIMNIC